MFSDVLCSLCPSSSKSSKKSGEFNFKYSLCINDLFIILTVIVDKDNIYIKARQDYRFRYLFAYFGRPQSWFQELLGQLWSFFPFCYWLANKSFVQDFQMASCWRIFFSSYSSITEAFESATFTWPALRDVCWVSACMRWLRTNWFSWWWSCLQWQLCWWFWSERCTMTIMRQSFEMQIYFAMMNISPHQASLLII